MSETVEQALREGVLALKKAGIDDAVTDARRLMAHAMNVPHDRLILVMKDRMSADQVAILKQAIAERADFKPVSQILGLRQFWGRSFKVTPAVLDPRPETELLVELASREPFQTVLDLGTGSGCILFSLLADMPNVTGLGVDFSHDALAVAVDNAQLLEVGSRVELRQSDWFSMVSNQYDLIVANPPYISADEMTDLQPEVLNWEPQLALTPGKTGLESYEIIAANAHQYLTAHGRIILEIGPSQADAVSGMFAASGFGQIQVHQDFDGRDRAIRMRKID